MIRKLQWVAAATIALLCAACDAHFDMPDTPNTELSDSIALPGHVLCTDGAVLSYTAYELSDKTAVAVLFDTEKRKEAEGYAYAVYLWDLEPLAFADSLGVDQGTSADPIAFDGNVNTSKLFEAKEAASPMAEAVFSMWWYGQSAYIPSVAEMRVLYDNLEKVNPIIERCGGQPLPVDKENCWYWTSTEVAGQETVKAWLYSLGSGTMHETPKNQAHWVRPIISWNK